jgi:hypothetical protein
MLFKEAFHLLCHCHVDLLLRMSNLVDQCAQQKLFLFGTRNEKIGKNDACLLGNAFNLYRRKIL